jgi:hypothetical protein
MRIPILSEDNLCLFKQRNSIVEVQLNSLQKLDGRILADLSYLSIELLVQRNVYGRGSLRTCSHHLTVFLGGMVQSNKEVTSKYNHYKVSFTIEENFRMSQLFAHLHAVVGPWLSFLSCTVQGANMIASV